MKSALFLFDITNYHNDNKITIYLAIGDTASHSKNTEKIGSFIVTQVNVKFTLYYKLILRVYFFIAFAYKTT